MAQTDCQIPLGYDGIVRILAVPHITLTPQKQTQPPLQSLDGWEVVVGGACENLAGLPPCRLEWIITSDCLPERPAPHPRETVLVPNGKRFQVKEKDGEGSRPLRLSAFELGLIGKGKLGYRIVPLLAGNEAVEVPPTDGRAIPFDLEAKIDFALAPVNLTNDWVPDWMELAWREPRVGTMMKLTPTFSPLFKGQLATLELFLAGAEQEKDATVRIEWEIGVDASTRLLWKIGYATVRGALGEVLNDRLAILAGFEPPDTMSFQYRLTVSRKPPAAGAAKPPPGASITAAPRVALELPRPRLKRFEVTLSKGKLGVRGSFEGFDDSVALDMLLKPYVRVENETTSELEELDDYFRSILQTTRKQASFPHDYQGQQSEAVCSPLDVDFRLAALDTVAVTTAKNGFERELLDLKGLPREYVAALKDIPGLQVFAVMKLAPAVISKAVPFGAIVAYEASEPGDGGGFAPFSNGTFVSKVFASGVCTANTMDLAGHAAVLHSPVPNIPPELREEFEIFVATVCGESIGQSENAWKGVAHTIMNRVARKYEKWKDCLTTTEVIQKSGFEAYEGKIFKGARAYMKSPGDASYAYRDKLQKMIGLITPIFMRQDGDGHGVAFFYSPKAQRQLAEQEAAKGNTSRSLTPGFVNQGGDKTLVRVTDQLLGGGGKKDDFEFYAFKFPEKFPRLTEEELAAAYEARKKAKK